MSNVTRNILVTGVGGDIAQSAIRCLLEEKEGANHIFGCDIDKYAAGRRYVEEFLIAPRTSDRIAYEKFLEDMIKEKKITHILPMTENEIEAISENEEKYGRLGAKLLINHKTMIKTFLDKYKTSIFLKENGFKCPETCLIGEYDGHIRPPLVMKPRKGHGGKGLVVVNNAEEFNIYKRKMPDDTVVQELIGGKNNEHTVGVFSDGKKIHSIIFRRHLSGEWGGYSRFVELVQNKEISQIAERLAKKCALEGSMNIQLKQVEGEYSIFEINPRISSTAYFRHFFGFMDVLWWINHKDGNKIEYYPKYKSGVGVKTYGETFFDLRPI
jgi:carbamoyl-phosphate synthase large subunit